MHNHPHLERLVSRSIAVLLMIEGKCSLRRAKPAHFVGHLPFGFGSFGEKQNLLEADSLLSLVYQHACSLHSRLALHRVLWYIHPYPMARSVNCVHLIGNLTRDPELRYT